MAAPNPCGFTFRFDATTLMDDYICAVTSGISWVMLNMVFVGKSIDVVQGFHSKQVC